MWQVPPPGTVMVDCAVETPDFVYNCVVRPRPLLPNWYSVAGSAFVRHMAPTTKRPPPLAAVSRSICAYTGGQSPLTGQSGSLRGRAETQRTTEPSCIFVVRSKVWQLERSASSSLTQKAAP